ncbi:hypothetical protein ACFXTN_023631 [Malus domestica]
MQPLHSTRFQRSKRRAQKSKRPTVFPDVSASVTYIVNFAKITGSLSKRRFQISEKHLLFQTCQRLSHAESALRKSQVVCQSADSRYRRGICFSKRVNACHMHT